MAQSRPRQIAINGGFSPRLEPHVRTFAGRPVSSPPHQPQLRLLDLPLPTISGSPDLTPFVKWPGGKSHELPSIAASAPALTGRYIDPFVGGGSVLLAVPADVGAWANDAVEDLVGLYRAAAEQRSGFKEALSGVARTWDALATLDGLYTGLAREFLDGASGLAALSPAEGRPTLKHALRPAGAGLEVTFWDRLARDIPTKFERMRRIQKEVGRLTNRDLMANVEGAVRAAFYMSIRWRYNWARRMDLWGDIRLADFFFLREFSYASMFRFNSRGEFNVPYGGMTYNRKSIADKADTLFGPTMLGRLQNTAWRSGDFEEFLCEAQPTETDFVFVDPPYDSDFSSYDNRSFDARDQERLQRTLEVMHANVMIVIKDTPLIRRLYRSDRWRVSASNKTYMWTIKSRNDREVVHLTITNY